MIASPKDKYIRKIDLAKMCGITDGGVSKAIKRGIIPVLKGGLINPSNKRVIDYINSCAERINKEKNKKGKNPSKPKKTKTQDSQQQEQPIEQQEPTDHDLAKSNNEALNINDDNVRFWKDVEDIRQKRLKSAQMRSELVSRDLVKQIFSKMYAVDSEQWKMLPASLANSLAAAFGQTTSENVQVAEKLIDEHVHLILKRVKRILEDAFKEMDIEGDF